MATVELDPQFIKALRLLRSKSKDSGAQLRAMLDDAIRQKKGLAPRSPSVSKQHSRSVSSDTERERSEKEKKKDLDRLKKDLSELVDRPTDPKRARLESPALSSTSLSHSPSPTSGCPSPLMGGENSNSATSDNQEYGDLEMNLEFDCSCCVCNSFVSESGNSLMECATCQNLYHQMCHNPPVTNDEAKDPRLIWNCMKCTKNKEAETGSEKSRGPKTEKPAKSSSSSGSVSGSSGRKSSSSGKNKSESRGSSGLGSGKSTGGSSANSSSSSGTSSSELSTSAKKRLKLLKKQAAASTVVKNKKSSK